MRVLPNLKKNQKFVAAFLDDVRSPLPLKHANVVEVLGVVALTSSAVAGWRPRERALVTVGGGDLESSEEPVAVRGSAK